MFERLFLNGGNEEGGWIMYTPANNTLRLYAICTDSSGNIYSVGNAYSITDECFVMKASPSGVIQWQRNLGDTKSDYWSGVSTDSSGNVYCFGQNSSSSAGGVDATVAKYDSAGTLLWQRRLGGATFDVFTDGSVDASGNVFAAGWTNSQTAGNADMLLAAYNTSGTIQWQRRFGGAQYEVVGACAIDSSNNVYLAGRTDTQTSGGWDALLVKYNSSGTLQFQRRLGGTGSEMWTDIGLDTSGNIYLVGFSTVSSTDYQIFAKYNSTGTLLWKKVSTTVGYSGASSAGAVDSSGNIYAGTNDQSSGVAQGGMLSKVDASGNLVWTRTLRYVDTTTSGNLNGFALDPTGKFFYIAGYYVTGSFPTINGGSFIAKFPVDGSKTGTYGQFQYSVGTLTLSNSSLTGATTTLTSATTTLTSATSTLTGSTPSISFTALNL